MNIGNTIKLPSDAFDCFICTQTLQYIPDIEAAVKTIFRILKPGGVLLATVPGIGQHIPTTWEYYSMFTQWFAKRLFDKTFSPKNVEVESFGNVLTATAYLYGMAAEGLTKEELDFRDTSYQFSIGIKAVKG